MKNNPLPLTNDEFILTQHINNKYRCLCSDCKEWRRLDNIRQKLLNDEYKQNNPDITL